MKKFVTIVSLTSSIIFHFSATLCYTQTVDSTETWMKEEDIYSSNYEEIKDPNVDYSKSGDRQAMYPNGLTGIYDHVARKAVYPRSQRPSKITAIITIAFVVDRDGYVRETLIMNKNKFHEDFELEAIKAVKSLKRFIPAKDRGKIFRSRFIIPITFAPASSRF